MIVEPDREMPGIIAAPCASPTAIALTGDKTPFGSGRKRIIKRMTPVTDPRFVCAMLLVTGVILLMIRFRPDPNGGLSPVKAMAVGLAQGAAMIPGISRSGSTIMAAIYLNVDRKQAADFSFLMSIPVILGATLLDVIDIVGSGASPNWVPLFIGALVAYVSGVWAIRVVLDFVKRGKLQYFGYYLFVVGTLGLIFIR